MELIGVGVLTSTSWRTGWTGSVTLLTQSTAVCMPTSRRINAWTAPCTEMRRSGAFIALKSTWPC